MKYASRLLEAGLQLALISILMGAPAALAVDEPSKEPGTPSGEVQERSIVRPPLPGGVMPGGPMQTQPPKPIAFECDFGMCHCHSEPDCNDLRATGLCTSWKDANNCYRFLK